MPARAPLHRSPSIAGARHHVPAQSNRQAKRALHTDSKAWKQQRRRVLARDLYICRRCGGFGDHVDHITGDAHELVTDDRLQTLCLKCHSAKTAREQGGFGNSR